MSIEIIGIEEGEQWNNIVKGFKKFDIYYLSNYTKALHIHGDGEPLLFNYNDKDMKAINVVMTRDIGKSKLFSQFSFCLRQFQNPTVLIWQISLNRLVAKRVLNWLKSLVKFAFSSSTRLFANLQSVRK